MLSIFNKLSLFTLLIPIGLAGFYLVYKIGKKLFGTSPILELPFLQKEGEFKIVKEGKYSIWHKGKLLMNVPMDEFEP